jgi:hypothetical protein
MSDLVRLNKVSLLPCLCLLSLPALLFAFLGSFSLVSVVAGISEIHQL